ncbi:MAG: YraN family protein [Chloroflexi bacterium]|nr:YraN family protein [Chloroflexota bacterium]MBM3182677.1 YraN family protein [Chloroflexota bacterium]MBM4452830.1 YraN family protein [Chloroflexota bacterium]MBM4453873.1 YraN family protein [Chloroflexota bacterium]
MNRKNLGATGEKLAKDFLKKRGYRIREANFRCRHGEIDIVAQKKGCLVFVEVRTKSSAAFGTPEESMTAAKKEKLVTTALSYINSHEKLPAQWRIDFVGVELDQKGKATRIELIENAVEAQ